MGSFFSSSKRSTSSETTNTDDVMLVIVYLGSFDPTNEGHRMLAQKLLPNKNVRFMHGPDQKSNSFFGIPSTKMVGQEILTTAKDDKIIFVSACSQKKARDEPMDSFTPTKPSPHWIFVNCVNPDSKSDDLDIEAFCDGLYNQHYSEKPFEFETVSGRR